MLFRALLTAFLVFPLGADALDAGEFHLYGVTKDGNAFDITPFGDGAVGDPESKRGFRSEFVRWIKPRDITEAKPKRICTAKDSSERCVRWELMQRVGRCTAWLTPTYRLSCAAGGLAFSGVTYAGEGLEESRVREVPDAYELYQSFLRRHDGARPVLAAVYRCKEGCKDSLPETLIFVWLGD